MNSSANSHPSTASEGKGLRRVRGDIPLRLWIVASITFWEKAAFWGLTAPWQNYMQHPRRLTDEETPGALGLGQVNATRIYCAFYIGYYLAPMLFAILSDTRLGNLFNVGCATMTISSLPSSLEKGWGLPGLIVAMVCVALGGGGYESVMAAFLADQYTDTEPRIKTLKSGEQVITDRSLTLEYIYGLNYWLGNVGSLSWFATVALEEQIGFAPAYGLTLGLIFIALLTLLIGKSRYLRVPRQTKIFAQASKILMCACRNRFRLARADPQYQLEHRHKIVPWSGELVDELRRALHGCRVLLAFVMFYVCFDQMQNNLISQSAQMERGSTPNDMLPAMNQIGCILFVPLIHHIIYPVLHRRHIYIRPIARITIGFCFVALSMAYAAILQSKIYSAGPCYDRPRACSSANREPNHVNVWIQAPVFFLIAMGEAWAYVTALEVAYSHAPKHMKAMIQAVFPLMAGVGSACAMGLTPIAHDPQLVVYYASLAGGMAATTIVFWLVFQKYDSRQEGGETQERAGSDLTQLAAQKQTNAIINGNNPKPYSVDLELGPTANSAQGTGTIQGHRAPTHPRHAKIGLENVARVEAGNAWWIKRADGISNAHSGPPPTTPTSPPTKHPISPPSSPTRRLRKLQKQQPQFSMVSSKPLPTLPASEETPNAIGRQN